MNTRLTGRAVPGAGWQCNRPASFARPRGVSTTSPSTPAVLRPAFRCVTCRTLSSVLLQLRSISFCRLRTLLRSPSCVALKILCRSLPTSPSWVGQSMAVPSKTSSSGPFTLPVASAIVAACAVVMSNLSFGSGAQASKRQWLTWSTSAPFRARHEPVCGQLCETAAGRSSLSSRFPAAFRPPAFACWTIQCPPGSWASLAVGLPGHRPDPDGVVTFRTAETRPGWVLSVPRGDGVPTAGS